MHYLIKNNLQVVVNAMNLKISFSQTIQLRTYLRKISTNIF